MVATLSPPNMKSSISIAKWYPRDDSGEFVSINSVFTKIEGTSNEVGRHTLRTALDGRLDRLHTDNLVKLARLCSMWSGERVTVDDLLVVTDN
jgi:hypothetical protein